VRFIPSCSRSAAPDTRLIFGVNMNDFFDSANDSHLNKVDALSAAATRPESTLSNFPVVSQGEISAAAQAGATSPANQSSRKSKVKPSTNIDPLPVEKEKVEDDEFSPEKLRVLNTLDMGALVTTELVEISVRKPKKDEWFRVLPGVCQQGGILEIQGNIYWVSQKLQSQLIGDPCFSLRLCVLAVTKQGIPFIWPLKLDNESGAKSDKFAKVPLAAMQHAQKKWTRIYWSREKFEHVVETANIADDPHFPDKPFHELLKLGFKATVISDLQHPALLELKGRAS